MVLPHFIIVICGISSAISIAISALSIYLQLLNYRKPFEQRLIIRIQVMVPLYAVTCFVSLVSARASAFIEPVREIYEAFVIYTFFNLLTVMLGGERNIMYFAAGRERVKHPGFLKDVLPPVDISDPYNFVNLKKGILQYVWLKPMLCLVIAVSQYWGVYDVNNVGIFSVYLWTGLIYNASVTMSLYCLAIFWKCLYDDLKPFKPWGKFLCVKLIIFASYWQGVILAICNLIGLLPAADAELGAEYNIGMAIQNALLCVELIGFSLGHWYSFNYLSFTKQALPNCSKVKFWYAVKDCAGAVDLVVDFKNILNNDFWSYRNFDSIENLIPEERSKIKRINQGMRYSHGGTQKYWLPAPSNSSNRSIDVEDVIEDEDLFISDTEFRKDEKLYSYAKRHYPFGDKNYPVEIEIDSYMYTRGFQTLRDNAALKYNTASNNSYGSV